MSVLPHSYSGSGKKEKVESMFDSIASRYDLLNRVLSAGIDRRWRKKVIRILSEHRPQYILDIATGTADLAIAAAQIKPNRITGIDISSGMLEVGRKKIEKKKLARMIDLINADSTNMPFAEQSFDAITVGFGIRNFEDLEKGLSEMFRVLKNGGITVILEFSKPQGFPVKQLYSLYSRKIMPAIGQLLSKQKAAYEYLPESVNAFPYGVQLLKKLEEQGFKDTKWIPLTFGIASIYLAYKRS